MSGKKLKYEKPTAVDMGAVSPVHGADCTSGNSASSNCDTGYGASTSCSPGNNPHTAPVCMPGNMADYNCSTGSTNMLGNCSNGLTARGCYSGDAP